MSKKISPIYVDLINSFKEQCNKLITTFKQKHYENFSDFAELFKSFKFGLIYQKHVDSFFYYDFKEDSLQVAKHLMLNDHFLSGLYLLYGLYYVQDEPKHSIRLEYSEFERIMELIKEERHTLLGTCQPGLVFAKLMRYQAFDFTYFSRDLSIEGTYRNRLINNIPYIVRERVPMNKHAWINQFLGQSDIVDELKRVDEQYFKEKHKLKKESDLNLALDMLPEDTIGGLVESLLDGDKMKTQQNVGLKRYNIKQGAMKKKQIDCSQPFNFFEDVKKQKGSARGGRKSYLNSVVNKTERSPSQSSDDSEVEYKLHMPNID